MKRIVGMLVIILLFSCNDNSAEMNKLKTENKRLVKKSTLSKKDSLKIFREINDNQKRKQVEMFIDSIKINDPQKFIFMKEKVNEDGTFGIRSYYEDY